MIRLWYASNCRTTYQLDIARLLKLALDQRAHLRMLFPGEQRRASRKT